MKIFSPPPARFLSFKTLTGKFGHARNLIVFLIFVFPLLNSQSANAIEVVISGATTFLCPNKSVTYTAKTYSESFGYEIYSCDI